MLHEAKTAVDSLETAQIDNTAIEWFNKNIDLTNPSLSKDIHKYG
jgi:hypothetical protein